MGRAARHFEDQGYRAFVELEHIGWLPAATFVWQRPFKILYDFLAKLRSQAEMTGRARSIAGEFGWLPDCKLTPEERSVVWEGFVAESHVDGGASARDVAAKDAAADAAAKIRRDKFNFNPEWQAHVDRIAARCVAEGKPVPFKRDIAAQLARQLGEKPATIARRTRSPRKQVPGTPGNRLALQASVAMTGSAQTAETQETR